MDLRTNEEVMGVHNRYSAEYSMFKVKETFEETDIKGNNNLFNSLKTDTLSDFSHNPGSDYKVNCSKKKKVEIDDSFFSYSSFKKAMDLRTHNRTLDGGNRTIFEDAQYFAENHCYKLLPITFEQVDETIIQSEHNYSLFSLTSESEPEEDCSRMMDYSQVKEKNYKRRRTKFREGVRGEELVVDGGIYGNEEPSLAEEEKRSAAVVGHPMDSVGLEPENFALVQPLDLSAGPPMQEEKEEKTESPSCEPHRGALENGGDESYEVLQPDSDKENASSGAKGIRVTITRPDEKENYEPCDTFLSDMARLVPWLIDKDCFEVDILDKTCDRLEELRKHRLYYVISESTWRSFQGASERVILTSDHSLGQPLRKPENGETPTYLVFDQFSLAKCLADYCQEIGGCFEYTCVEEGERERKREVEEERLKASSDEEMEGVTQELEGGEERGSVVERMTEGTAVETMEEKAGVKEKEFYEASPTLDEELSKVAESMKDDKGKERRKKVSEEEVQEVEKVQEVKEVEKVQEMMEVEKVQEVKEIKEVKKVKEDKEVREVNEVKEIKDIKEVKNIKELKEARKVAKIKDCVEKRVSKGIRPSAPVSKGKPLLGKRRAKTKERRDVAKPVTKGKETRKRGKSGEEESGEKVLPRRESNDSRVTTRSKTVSESETSHKSDERVRREERKRGGRSALQAEPPVKLKRAEAPTEPGRRTTRSRKGSEKAKTTKPPAAKKEKKESAVAQGRRKEAEVTGRTLRSQKVDLRKKNKVAKTSKGRNR